MENLRIEDFGYIFDVDELMERLCDMIHRYITVAEFDEIMRSVPQNVVEHYPKEIEDLTSTCDEADAGLKLVLVPQLRGDRDCEVWLSYIRDKKDATRWIGAFVGTKQSRIKHYYKQVNHKDFFEKIVRDDKSSGYLENIYNALYYKEHWYQKSEQKPYGYLESYLFGIFGRVRSLRDKGNSEHMLFNTTGDRVVFNTSLIDIYRNYIHIMYNYDRQNKRYSNPQYVASGYTLRDNNFPTRKLSIPPAKLYDSPSDVIFSGTMDDFDLNNAYQFNHIINERRDRMTDALADVNPSDLYLMIQNSVEFAVRFSQVDHKYIVPMYNIEDDKIQFLLPIYTSVEAGTKPMFVLVIGYVYDCWVPKTVLTMEQAYINARIISSAASNWLTLE